MTDFNMIAVGVMGSTAYGTNTVDSDTDIMGVYLEDKKYVTGIFSSDRGTSVRTYEAGERAKAGDTDGAYYPLRHFIRLASDGNPNITPFFYLDKHEVTNPDAYSRMMSIGDIMPSKRMGRNCLGYMTSQRTAMIGTYGKHTNRPELVHKYGYDTKFAYHMIRVGLMGLELLDTGMLQLPLKEANVLLGIRNGLWTKEHLLAWSSDIEADLVKAIIDSELPADPDLDEINKLLHNLYMEEWEK